MFQNYFRHGWRNLFKNKLSSLINIGGLAIGLATGIIILLWIHDEFSFDAFHKNLPGIYLVMNNQQREGTFYTGDVTPGPLAEKIRDGLPEIKYAVRAANGGQQLLGTGSKSIYQSGLYTDPDFFNIFTFPAVAGDPAAALEEPGNIILTESAAARLFGKDDAIGRVIRHNNQHDLKVAAVIRDAPPNSTTRFDMILPFHLFEAENPDWVNRWDNSRLNTWIMLQPGSHLAGFNEKLKNLSWQQTRDSAGYWFAYPLAALRIHGSFRNGQPSGGHIETITLLGSMGLLILLIACINFMNLSTARSERRAREVGVKKVLGASRQSIVFQFLAEALIITFLALLLGLLLAKLAIPGLNRISGKNIAFSFLDGKIWAEMLGLTLFTGLVAGSYPAFFLSRFQPAKVLKGEITPRRDGFFRKSLVTFQFIISIFLIITTIVIYKQLQFGENRPVGYLQDNLLEIPARGDMGSKFTALKNDLLQIPGVESVSAGSDNLLQFNGAVDDMQWPGKTPDQDFPVNITWVQYDWIKTTGLQLVAGRDFSAAYGSDSAACLINEAAVKKMGLKEPVIGTIVGSSPVIGVIKDFVANNPYRAASPLVVCLGKVPSGHFFVRLRPTDHRQPVLERIAATVKRSNPQFPFEFNFTKEAYQRMFTGIRSSGFMINWGSSLAILISCLGLFGLSTFLAERRTKEIGIRKIMGASPGRIWLMLAKDFLKPVLIAFIITVPPAIFAMRKALDNIDYRISLQWWMFGAAGMAAAIIALITVSYEGVRAAKANPVKALQAG